MKNWKKRIIIALLVIFFSANLFLIVKKESKITRVERINHWENVKIGQLKNSLLTEGIVIPEEEYHVYFNENHGVFKQFYVKKGEEVSIGTPLFEYSPFNTSDEIGKLETEITELENKASSVDTAIDQLEALLDEARSGQKEKERQDELESVYNIQSNIYEKELEKEFYLGEAARIQEQIRKIEEKPDSIVVESEFDGYVKNVKYDLSAPVITISSKTPSIKGSLSETEIHKVEEGMKVSIGNKEADIGTISDISPLPENEPEIDQESTYPIRIQVDNPSDDLIAGKHVNVGIILEEAAPALIIPETSIKKKKSGTFINVLSSSGTVEKRSIQTGIESNQKLEVISGVNKEDVFASNAEEVKYSTHSPFTTPIKIKELSKSSLKQSLKSKWKYIVRGFFH
ncbi:efflux RND transporter periplasmic adaptor subunit [Cytobacillus depressus]|uniref:Efflux RND transporter periplasmic adaptor subunit n=1 Tax=Cytobacillus depressus TaxID=1602942 RepID=A0A6L3VC56_9BACI|nr:efflux RND transporter periplasmic adaptor subunit [Cytobacillus depressus]KAB2336773.1 efflux RND transporter periplasmic adaptor subunit [Cytobacillus depressus]